MAYDQPTVQKNKIKTKTNKTKTPDWVQEYIRETCPREIDENGILFTQMNRKTAE